MCRTTHRVRDRRRAATGAARATASSASVRNASARGLAGAFAAVLVASALVASSLVASAADRPACARGTLYLTIDTGNMRFAEEIAATLQQHDVRATFFLANEKTFRGDHALDASWAPYWQARVREGHAFGSHTWRHGKFQRDVDGAVVYAPQFGENAGRSERMDAKALCRELVRVDDAFDAATGRHLDRLWRAPGGRTTPNALRFAAQCGFRHVHWSPAGFLGDELPSDRYPNDALVAQALANLRDGDVLMMHLGIWSRREPFAPALGPLLAGLGERGFCFATLAPGGDGGTRG
jgi:peptidoglycan/xylan/chitin deacetylase (PgdA/CDA1 family)